MFRSVCAQCGADVEFRSASAVVAICPYCRSTLLKSGDALERIGAMTEALEDYSPIRIGVTGRYQGRAFTVVGRIQLRYSAGYWNEWYCACDDGNDAWLSDASGDYVMTARDDLLSQAAFPAFEEIKPGAAVRLGEVSYQASDIRTAQCSGGEGELPFHIGDGWVARVVDCRCDDAFATLDYSDAGVSGQRGRPVVYRGAAVELDGLGCQGLRDEREIRESAGRYRGDVVPFDCPKCGAPVSFVAGLADFVTCGTCHAGIDCTGDKAQVFSKHREVESVETALSLGDKATFDGAEYTVLGLLRCRDTARWWTWDEYLLFHPIRGFFWLVHSDEGWDRVKVLNRWPVVLDAERVRFETEVFSKAETYESEITYATGAFNWRAAVGDKVQLTDYQCDPSNRITSESSAHEWVWSRCTRIPAGKIAERFGKPALARAGNSKEMDGEESPESTATSSDDSFSSGSFGILPWVFSGILAVINLDAVLEAFLEDGIGWLKLLVPLSAIWLPPFIADKFDT